MLGNNPSLHQMRTLNPQSQKGKKWHKDRITEKANTFLNKVTLYLTGMCGGDSARDKMSFATELFCRFILPIKSDYPCGHNKFQPLIP